MSGAVILSEARMSLRLWTVSLIALTVLTAGVVAQGPPLPKIRVPQPVGGPGEELVEDPIPYLAGLKKVPKPKDVDPRVLKDLMDKVGKMPKDKQPDQKQIEELLKNNPQFKDPAFLKQLQKLVESPDFPDNLQQKLGQETPRPPIPENPGDLADKFKKVIEGGNQPDGLGGLDPKGGQPDLPKLPDADGTPKPNFGDSDWGKFFEKTFGDSPAGQAAMKDLASSLESTLGKGGFDQFPEFKGDMFKDFDFKGPGGESFKLKPPDMDTGGWAGPKVGEVGSGGSSFGGGGGGSSFGSGGGADIGTGGGSALAIIAGIAGAIFLTILLMRKWQLNREAARTGSAITHGPLDFSGVRTREQLVEAFDTVSLDTCGDEARAWNHRVIADQIGDVKPAHAEPAAELGRMYEVARYAPPDEDLQPTEYAEARKDLSVIAGVPA